MQDNPVRAHIEREKSAPASHQTNADFLYRKAMFFFCAGNQQSVPAYSRMDAAVSSSSDR